MTREDDERNADLVRAEQAREAAAPPLERAVQDVEDAKEAHPVARWTLFAALVVTFCGGVVAALARAC